MNSFYQIILACILTNRELSHAQEIYKPYGPRMCQALYLKQTSLTAWNFDDVHLVCKLTVTRAREGNHDDRSHHSTYARMTEPQRKTDSSLHGFLLQTKRSLFRVDNKLRKEKLSVRPKTSTAYIYNYDKDNGVLYTGRNNIIYRGVIGNKQVNFNKYRHFRGDYPFILQVKLITNWAVDIQNSMAALILPNYIIKCYNTTTMKPQILTKASCGSYYVVLDKKERFVYFTRDFKLFSMDYFGNGKKIFEKIKISYSFSLESKENHIFCTTQEGRDLLKYNFDKTSRETTVTRTSLKCSPRNLDLLVFAFQFGELILSSYQVHQGLLVEKGRKCYWIWKHLAVIDFRYL